MHLAFFLVCLTFVADFNVFTFFSLLIFPLHLFEQGTFSTEFILEYFDYTRKRIIFISPTYTLYDFGFNTEKSYVYLPIAPRHLTTRTLCDTFNNVTRYTTLKSLVTFQLDRMRFLRYFNFSGYMYITLFIVCNLSR